MEGRPIRTQHYSGNPGSYPQQGLQHFGMCLQGLQRHHLDLLVSKLRHVWLGASHKGQGAQRSDHNLQSGIDTIALACLFHVKEVYPASFDVTHDSADDAVDARLESRSDLSIYETQCNRIYTYLCAALMIASKAFGSIFSTRSLASLL